MEIRKLLYKGLSLFVFILAILVVYRCKNSISESDYFQPKILATHYDGEKYVGSETCMECHSDIYESHIKTAHFNTSSPADSVSINGSFKEGFNTLKTKGMEFIMTMKEDSFYQQANFKYADHAPIVSKIDIVIGSGVKGQTYLTWDDDKLSQLQASYFTETNSWINSPGYPEDNFRRPITDDCLKCHVTFAKNVDSSGKTNRYIREQIVFGVDCERCHGPSEKHVVYRRKNGNNGKADSVLQISKFTRQQRLDMCAQCHSGLRNRQLKGYPFSFMAGENLAEYSQNFYTGKSNSELDVHGNQYGLLTSSACFENSTMDCMSCHDPHQNQRGATEYFNQNCIQCHNSVEHVQSLGSSKAQNMYENCISCHMPLSPSETMKVKLDKDSLEIPVQIRTHLIGIYTDLVLSNQ